MPRRRRTCPATKRARRSSAPTSAPVGSAGSSAEAGSGARGVAFAGRAPGEEREGRMSPETETQEQAADGKAGGQESLSVTDNRTGKKYDIPIEDGTIRGMALRDIKVD